jgi:membrane protein EpsK
VSLNHTGTVLFLSIELVIANTVLGAHEAGRYALALQWSTLIRAFAGSVAGVFGPTILHLHARDEIEALIRYARRSAKLLGLLLALPVALVCGFARPLLTLWLGQDFADLSALMVVLTAHLCLNLGYLPLHTVSLAANRVRVPAAVSIALGVVNVLLAVLLAGPAGWGVYGIAAAGALTLTAKNVFFTPLYSAYLLRRPRSTFVLELLPTAGVTVVLIGAATAIASIWRPDSWLELLAASGVVASAYCAGAWHWLLDDVERSEVMAYVRRWQAADPGRSRG